MSDETTNPAVYDTVIRFTVKQGTEHERCPSTIDDNKKRPTNTTTVGAKDFDAYYYFPSGELIYTRDTGRLFIGNYTYPAITAGSISESGIKNQITPGGVLVGNKYLGSFSDLAFDNKHFKFSEYNSNTDAYNGDYRFDASSSILYLYDTNVVAPKLTTEELSSVHSTSAISDLLDRLKEGTSSKKEDNRKFIPFFNFIPDGRTLDIDNNSEGNKFYTDTGDENSTSEDSTSEDVSYKFKILKVVNIESEPVHQWFDHSKNNITKDNKVTTDFYVGTNNKLKLRLNETILKKLYQRTAVEETEKHRVVITDNNGNLHIYSTISKLELDKLNGLANYRRYDLNNNKSMSYIGLNQHIGQPFYIGSASTVVNKGKYNEETYRTTYIKGSHVAKDEKMSSKWNTAYSTLWGNIGEPEWVDGTNRGSIWSNIGQSNNYVGESGHNGRNTAANQAPTYGLAHYDHNINSSGKAQGNVIDIWYNIGDPLAYANIWKYENGKRTNTKQVSGNVVPVTSGYSSGYRYQTLWESIGARKQSATDAKHYNLWNHIGDKTSYTTKLQTISWPSSPSSNPIPTIGTKADSLSTLKTTVWGGIENLRSQIKALYDNLKNACIYIKGYVDKQITDARSKLTSYVDTAITKMETSITKYIDNEIAKVYMVPNYNKFEEYKIPSDTGNEYLFTPSANGYVLFYHDVGYNTGSRTTDYYINNKKLYSHTAGGGTQLGHVTYWTSIFPIQSGNTFKISASRYGISSTSSIYFIPAR